MGYDRGEEEVGERSLVTREVLLGALLQPRTAPNARPITQVVPDAGEAPAPLARRRAGGGSSQAVMSRAR